LRRITYFLVVSSAVLVMAGCPRNEQEFDAGRKAEAIQDYDTALVHYERAVRGDPSNAEYKLRQEHMRFEDGQFHVEQGRKAIKKGDLQQGLAEFEKAQSVDPSNNAADQEIKKTMELIGAKSAADSSSSLNPNPPDDEQLLAAPPGLKPLSREPINLKMTNDSRAVFEAIAKLAGLSVIFDPDFTSKRITAELPNVTLEQALDAVAAESKAFWKPMTPNVILVATDNAQKRKDLEDEVVRTFYLSNTLTPQDLTEIVTGLRQLLDLRRVQQVNAQNAIVIRDTPDKLVLAGKIIRDIDKAKPEVLIHVQVLTADRDRLRDLGVLPGQTVSLTFTPRTSVQPNSSSTSSSSSSSSTSTTSVPQITLNNLKHLSTADYSLTLPGASASAILTDNKTRIIQDPEVRVSDGQKATLKIGERVPVATGSFQAGVGVGVGGGAGVVNPLVNTQFQYIDVGVNVDVTPRVHPNGDVSMKVMVEVSAIAGTSSIGGINQPVISSRKIENDIRLKDGEVNIIGGLIQRTNTLNLNGIPGLAQLPLVKYLFSDNSKEVQSDEVLIVMTPHILRLPSISAENLRTLAAGTDTNVRVYREDTDQTAAPQPVQPSSQQSAPQGPATQNVSSVSAAQLHFEPATATLRAGETKILGLSVSNVTDLYSIPLLIHYNPAVIQVDEVRNGGFLSGGTQDIAIVQRIDAQRGEVVVSATRQPNTPGVNGTGTLLGIVVRAVGPGSSPLQILQVNAHDSQQRAIPMVSGEATIQVQ
jgi:general secretion pathway protein D